MSRNSSPTIASLDSCNTLANESMEKTNIKDIHFSGWSIPSHTNESTTDTSVSTIEDVESQTDAIPAKFGCRMYRFLRWNLFSPYRRLFTLVFLINLGIFLCMATGFASRGLTYSNLTTATSANLLLSIVLRQEHVVNFLFLVSSSLPLRAPIILRRCCARVYGYGGIHSGCAVAGTLWFSGFTGLVTKHLFIEPLVQAPLAIITYSIILLLFTILIFAHPFVRSRIHNCFEIVHRFAGWMSVALFWALMLLTVFYTAKETSSPYGQVLLRTPTFWFLIIITICVIYPWTRLRKVQVRPEPLSEHAVRLHFDYCKVSYCMGLRLADVPIKETHAFAAIPEPNGAKGFSVVVSNAGDWTRRIIQNPPSTLWVKGVPCYGVLRIAAMFKPVLIVATGSGIGPCLSLFNGRPDLRCRILWSTQNPFETYGRGIIEQVLETDKNAVIVNTSKSGRPDMVSLTFKLYKESGAEAVVIISNPKVTKKVVYGLETRGVPAYGPIFDS